MTGKRIIAQREAAYGNLHFGCLRRYCRLLALILAALRLRIAVAYAADPETDGFGALQRCNAIADSAARLACLKAITSGNAQRQASPTDAMRDWHLVRTPNPRSGADAVSITHTADVARSDLGLAGLMLRCGRGRVDVLIVLVEPLPPRARPTVIAGTDHFEASVIPPGAAILLPNDASMLVNGSWQSRTELPVEVKYESTSVRGVIPLVGLREALRTLTSNCPRQ